MRRDALRILSLGVLLTAAFLFANVFVSNYRATDGYWLPNGKEVGGDFLALYTGGEFFRRDRRALYDLGAQLAFQKDLFLSGSGRPPLGALVYVYPPTVALLLSLFTDQSFLLSFYRYLALAGGVVCASIIALGVLRGWDWKKQLWTLLFTFAFMPLTLECLAAGQTSWMGLAVLSATFIALKRRAEVIAGVLLSLGAYKAPLFAVLALALLLRTNWRFRGGFAFGGALQFCFLLWAIGWSGALHYFDVGTSYRYGVDFAPGLSLPPSRGIALYALFTRFFGATSALWLLGGVIVGFLSWYWRKMRRVGVITELEFCALATLSLVLSPHIMVYELAMLVPLMLLALDVKEVRFPVALRFSVGLLFCEWLFRSSLSEGFAALIPMLALGLWATVVTNEWVREQSAEKCQHS